MRKLFIALLFLVSAPSFAQIGLLDRFDDPEKGHVTFIGKGNRAMGIAGSYRSLVISGDRNGDGFSILSLLNMGNGAASIYELSPSFSYFVADDLSVGVNLDYSGYSIDTNLKLDFRDIVMGSSFLSSLFMASSDDTSSEEGGEESSGITQEEADELAASILNPRISGRHYVRNAWGSSIAVRKYLSFFGSKTVGIFGEARLYGNYAQNVSCPIDKETGEYNTAKNRFTDSYSVGLKIGGGACIRLRDNSALTVSVPILGAAYNYTKQFKTDTRNEAHMGQFQISRDVDFLSVLVGYTRYIEPKKKK